MQRSLHDGLILPPKLELLTSLKISFVILFMLIVADQKKFKKHTLIGV
jgi:hypothetical protein